MIDLNPSFLNRLEEALKKAERLPADQCTQVTVALYAAAPAFIASVREQQKLYQALEDILYITDEILKPEMTNVDTIKELVRTINKKIESTE